MKEEVLHRQDTSPPPIPRVRLLPITGLAGAGRTRSLKALEDLGFEVIDNLPLSLIGSLLFPLIQPGEGDHAITIAVDFREKNFSTEAFDQATAPLADRDDIEMTTVFLDCDNEVLARRFTETRRCHPLGADRPVMDGIVREWHLLAPFKKRADLVIDTTKSYGRGIACSYRRSFPPRRYVGPNGNGDFLFLSIGPAPRGGPSVRRAISSQPSLG